jgi:immunoglobulin-binding protein 1
MDRLSARVVDDSVVGGARGRKDLEAEETEGVEEVGKEEDDSEEALQKARDWDEFKEGEGRGGE